MTKKVEKTSPKEGKLHLQKEKRKRQKQLISEVLLDYVKNSTLHGLRYIVEKGLSSVEKLFWIVTFTGSVVLCSFLIRNVYVKWRTSPVIVTVSERLVSVGEVPFPSVTICPQIKSKATVYNFSKEFEKFKINMSETSKQYISDNKLADISLVCGGLVDDISIFKRLFTNSSIIDHIDYVAPGLDESLIYCAWQNNSYSICDKLFKKVYTAEGVCYNMNSLAAEEVFRDTVQTDYKYSERSEPTRGWSLEDGYTETEKTPFPLQGSENGATPTLEVYLINDADDSDGLCNGWNSGFKIYIQHPTDHPQSSLYYYAALDNQVSSMAISADILSSSSSLADYPAEIRQCFFQKDRQLYYFKIYTASNCRAECLSNYTFQECGCVGYYMPHDNSSQICVEGKMDCMEKAQNALAKRELKIKINGAGDGCHCLPACNSVEYNAKILKTGFHYKKFMHNYLVSMVGFKENYFNDSSKMYSKMELYFKKPQFVSMRRSELFGLTDFLADIGGLLGVFLGFSFLSLIELFYFVTFRLTFTLKRNMKFKKRSTNLSDDVEKNC